jgi:hypothetical protein
MYKWADTSLGRWVCCESIFGDQNNGICIKVLSENCITLSSVLRKKGTLVLCLCEDLTQGPHWSPMGRASPFNGRRVWTQGVMLTRQALYHLRHCQPLQEGLKDLLWSKYSQHSISIDFVFTNSTNCIPNIFKKVDKWKTIQQKIQIKVTIIILVVKKTLEGIKSIQGDVWVSYASIFYI